LKKSKSLLTLGLCLAITACSSNKLPSSQLVEPLKTEEGKYIYRIGASDVVSVLVWNNQDVSGDFPVSPDGKISMSLTGTISVVGKSTEDVEKIITAAMSDYIKSPKVTVQIKNASGNTLERVKIIGDAVTPAAFPYKDGMTLLDIMIAVGGLSPYADGNDAELLRFENGKLTTYPLKIEDLMEDANLEENVDLLPGDVIRIPEAWF